MTANDQPIERRPLHHTLVERLRAMINAGELAAGERIPEQALCERFNVSRTPLREALRVLSADGYVELRPNRGAAVARLTLQDLEDVFPVMASLEALSGELACARITDAEIASITRLHEEMVSHHHAHNLSDYFRLNAHHAGALHGQHVTGALGPRDARARTDPRSLDRATQGAARENPA
jgi:DNA-binding GntR family transcriptional regulator